MNMSVSLLLPSVMYLYSSSPQLTMASTDRGAATPGYEPQPRKGHALVEYKGCTYLVGGRDSKGRPIGLSSVEVFNPTTLKWQRRTTSGETPVDVFHAACAVVRNCLYVFGGGVYSSVSNALWRLHLESLQWSPVQQTNKPPPRRDAWLVADKQQRLVLYSGEGANDETLKDLHVFSIKDGEWFSVYCRTGSVMAIHFGFGLTGIHKVDWQIISFVILLQNI